LLRFGAAAFVTASIVASSPPAIAGTVSVPIRLDEQFLRRLVIAQVFTEPGESAVIWDDPLGCGGLTLTDPKVTAKDGKLFVRSTADARWGISAGETCLLPVSWNGLVEVVEQPRIEADRPIVHFEVIDTSLYRKNGRKAGFAARFWSWINGYVHPRMSSISVDLHSPVENLRQFLPLILPAAYVGDAEATLASVTLDAVRVEDGALVIDVELTSPDPAPGSVAVEEPPLDVREVEQWDAFLTFVVKQAALDIEDVPLRATLLGVLLDSRYEIVEALTSPAPDARDPVPGLFRNAWARLAPALRDLEGHVPGGAALRYLAFVAAGDALLAIDRLGPGSGLDISADGLRRLARIVAPEETGDPLEYATVVDPSLRESFGFGPPLPLPASPPPLIEPPAPDGTAPSTTSTTTTTTVTSDQSPTTTTTTLAPPPPTLPAPAPTAPPEPAPVPSPVSDAGPRAPSPLVARALAWLIPAAEAADAPQTDASARLRNWAPTRKDLDQYLPIVQRVLHRASDDTLQKKPVDEPYSTIFRPLVLATAWKETCWRQFIRRAGKVIPLRSSAGAVGMMQVNPRVWRGFYDVSVLETDTAYNATAGAEILQHYLVDYAIRKKEHELGGGIDALARATYAAYNGGPGHLGRYRSAKTAKSLRQIDADFWRYYQTVKGGNELGVRECYSP
jgi:soluble lytic murein transglycosylase-like protein